jgi:hypothetical protein
MADFVLFGTIGTLSIIADRYTLCRTVPTVPPNTTQRGNELIYFCNKYRTGVGLGIFCIVLYVWCLAQDYYALNEKPEPEQKPQTQASAAA